MAEQMTTAAECATKAAEDEEGDAMGNDNSHSGKQRQRRRERQGRRATHQETGMGLHELPAATQRYTASHSARRRFPVP